MLVFPNDFLFHGHLILALGALPPSCPQLLTLVLMLVFVLCDGQSTICSLDRKKTRRARKRVPVLERNFLETLRLGLTGQSCGTSSPRLSSLTGRVNGFNWAHCLPESNRGSVIMEKR